MNMPAPATLVAPVTEPQAIMTLETTPYVRGVFPGRVTPMLWAVFISTRTGKPLPPATIIHRGSVKAHVNHNRWIVQCPFCSSAELASKVHRMFWCAECQMRSNDGCALNVIFPAPRTMAEIETVLLMRENIDNRNWFPHETVAQLARENLDHGAVRRIA